MNRPEHDEVTFFSGNEVEHSPAYGMKTLFVVGVQNPTDIQKILDDPFSSIDKPIEHIYFGANQSFPKLQTNDFVNWNRWEIMIEHFLNKGYWCTLDLDISNIQGLLESALCEHGQFIPMISAKIPYIRQLGYNAVLKLDDRDFAATNPGVWCHSLHELTRRDGHFTDWKQYTKDQTL